MIQALIPFLLKPLSRAIIESLVLMGLRKLAAHSESKVDDEIVKVVEDAVRTIPK